MTEPAARRPGAGLLRLAVAMPAYNEAEALPGFLAEIAEALLPVVGPFDIVVADDRSTDDTVAVLGALEIAGVRLHVARAVVNRGHGPTALLAYREALGLGADVVLHVDGDGQFLGADFPRVLAALDGADVVHGVRTSRSDPWFRRVLTALTATAVAMLTGHRVPDVNTPLRAYRRSAIETLTARIPEDALVPHVHFSLLERGEGLRVHHVRVRSIPRRGASAVGTMWGRSRTPSLPSGRLLRFSRDAALEVMRLRIRRPRPVAAATGDRVR